VHGVSERAREAAHVEPFEVVEEVLADAGEVDRRRLLVAREAGVG
jgi:hypothetical protein